ncbi:hypothetical protein RN001_006727 [Aquatica leii]|uniref:Uncharacterized protein n=1 Tax=Aquatica leii TaxID=1421715 RepID=A0AAN7SQB4_9COLE|nr:hypothetical protein RN001_006727 [Aquatica leii]
MYGFTTKYMISIAYQLADKNNIDHPFSKETSRACAFNRPVVTKFFRLLKTVYDKTQFPARCIFNLDETLLSTVPARNCKILAKRGKKQVGRVVSAERGLLLA